jgi:hypothetical protein
MSNVNAIAALLPIPDEKRRRRCLLLYLRKVRWYRAMRELDTQTIESPKVSRAELAKVARQARKLRATLEALPFAARLALVSEAARSEHLEQSFDGLLRRRGAASGLFSSLDRRQEILGQLATEAEAAKAKLKKSRPGAERNDALYWLVQEIAEIWREHVDTRFARSDNRDSASDFVRALVDLVDPEIGSGTLDLAMREAIGKIRPRKNR